MTNDIHKLTELVNAYRLIWSQPHVLACGGINLMPFAEPNEIKQVTLELGEQDNTLLMIFTNCGNQDGETVALTLDGAEQLGCLLLGFVTALRALASTAPHCSK